MTEQVKDMMFEEVEKDQIRKHEGYKGSIYYDSVGVPTGGWGHAFHIGSSLPKEIWEQIFNYDYRLHKDQLNDLIWQRKLMDLDHVRKMVLMDMIFNLGMGGLLKFKNTLRFIEQGNYEQAADNMLQSKWATQVGERAKTLARQMRTGRV